MQIRIAYTPNKKQKIFHSCAADEVVYGGSKGGGKSCALVMECLAYCLENKGATAYLFRETYDDLEANLVQEWKQKVPKELYEYSESKHIASLRNGSRVLFRYISNDEDADGYQGRSIDFIGIDELTKHSEKAVQVLLSCLRSPKGFKPLFRGTCNPGGKGHTWVKKRYIEATGHGAKQYRDCVTGNIIAFIPAQVYDNEILMKNDPAYVRRLENLPDAQKKAFLYGDWTYLKDSISESLSMKCTLAIRFQFHRIGKFIELWITVWICWLATGSLVTAVTAFMYSVNFVKAIYLFLRRRKKYWSEPKKKYGVRLRRLIYGTAVRKPVKARRYCLMKPV